MTCKHKQIEQDALGEDVHRTKSKKELELCTINVDVQQSTVFSTHVAVVKKVFSENVWAVLRPIDKMSDVRTTQNTKSCRRLLKKKG